MCMEYDFVNVYLNLLIEIGKGLQFEMLVLGVRRADCL